MANVFYSTFLNVFLNFISFPERFYIYDKYIPKPWVSSGYYQIDTTGDSWKDILSST